MKLQFCVLYLALKLVNGFAKFYMEEKCDMVIKLDIYGEHAGKFKPTRTRMYKPNMNCRVTLQTAPTHQIVVVFKRMEIEFEPYCDDDYLQLFDGNTTKHPTLRGLDHKLCGEDVPEESYVTSGEYLTILFRSDSWASEDGFELIFTIFHTGDCVEGEFKCMNGRCISRHLKCDGWNNCGDNSDECTLSVDVIFAVICSVAMVTITGIVVITCIRRRSKNEKDKEQNEDTTNNEIHDHIHEKYERSMSLPHRDDYMDKIVYVKTAEGLPW